MTLRKLNKTSNPPEWDVSESYLSVPVTLLCIWLGKTASGNSSYPWQAPVVVKKLWKYQVDNEQAHPYSTGWLMPALNSFLQSCVSCSVDYPSIELIIGALTRVMEDGSALFLGFLISRERTVSISNSFRPSLLVSGLKQQPPESKTDEFISHQF